MLTVVGEDQHRFLHINILPWLWGEGFENMTNCLAAYFTGLGHENKVICKEQMGKLWPIAVDGNGFPKVVWDNQLYFLWEDLHAKDEDVRADWVPLSKASHRGGVLCSSAIDKNDSMHRVDTGHEEFDSWRRKVEVLEGVVNEGPF